MKRIIIVSLILSLVLVGCSKSKNDVLEYLQESDYGSFAAAVNEEDAINILPGKLNVKEFEVVDSNRLIVKYDTSILGEENIDKYDLYWEDDESFKKILLFNASVLFSKNEDINNINFYLETKKMIYTVYVKRNSIEKYIFNDLSSLDSLTMKSGLVKNIENKRNMEEYYKLHSVFNIAKDEEDCWDI